MKILLSIVRFLVAYRNPVLFIYALLCVVTFFLYGADKSKARREKWRVPEKTLLLFAFFGAPGALLGMYLFRHKTKHLRFRILVPFFFILHVGVVCAVFYLMTKL